MPIHCAIDQTVSEGLFSFLKDMNLNSMHFKLLCFWGRHPKAKLSLYTMTQALGTSRINLRDAITDLVNKGILSTEHNIDGLTTYTLANQQIQEHIEELARLDWSEKYTLGKQF